MSNENRIVVTGASGKTGKAIISQLSGNSWQVIAFTHKEKYQSELLDCGAQVVFVGDLRSQTDLEKAITGSKAIYHICPNMTPDEYEIGKKVIAACQKAGVKRFIYHSVFHPQIQSMPHHWQKLLVEEELFKSSLQFTILQPTAYMQNILGYRKAILEGKFPVPYSAQAEISLVDLRDVARAALQVLRNDRHTYGIYELIGTPPLSQTMVANALAAGMGKPVVVQQIDRTDWDDNARSGGMPDYARETLLAMFEYYESFGLKGSPTVLSYLLGKKPITMKQFVKDYFSNETVYEEYP